MASDWSKFVVPCSLVLAFVSATGSLALGVRFLFVSVGVSHPAILLYLLAEVGRTWAWVRHPREIAPMGWAETVTVIATVGLLYTLLREALTDYPAIRRTASQLLIGTICGCLIFGLAVFWFNPNAPDGRSPDLQKFNAEIQSAYGGVFAFLALFSAFLAWFPLKIRRNTVYILVGVGIYFSTHCVALLLVNILPGLSVWSNLLESLLECTLLICGLVLINRDGDTVPVTTSFWDPIRMRELTQQLEAINAKLSDPDVTKENY